MTIDLETMKTIKKSLGLVKYMMYLEQTPISCRELVFYLAKILRDIIIVYTSLCFLLNKAVNPPVIEMYINPAAFY